MSTQLQSLDSNPNSEWKDKYYQTLDELEEKEKTWAQEESGLYKSILRLILTYTGLDEDLDKQLASMRDNLKKETGNSGRNKIISPVIEEVLSYARKQDPENTQADNSLEYLASLLKKLKLPDKYQKQLKTINKSLTKNSERKNIQACINQLCSLIGEAASTNNTDAERIQLKTDDPLTHLLENLSLPGELGIEVMTLRKRAVEIEEEQDRLQLIQDLVQLLSRHTKNDEGNKADVENFPHLKDTLLELFEWLSIPEEYGKRVELVKTRIASLQADPDLSAVLRDTAIVINDLQAALQVELGDIQVFLAKVTSRLEEVESCFRDLSSSEKENRKDTKQLNTDIQTSVNNIRLGITESDDIQAMKQSIESRLSFIEQSAGNYLQSSQKRQQFWEGTVNILKGRIQSMKGETVSLHKRI
ncbi:MAG: diguanylate cyclase, partial [Gammaproteobacteria bacterium]